MGMTCLWTAELIIKFLLLVSNNLQQKCSCLKVLYSLMILPLEKKKASTTKLAENTRMHFE